MPLIPADVANVAFSKPPLGKRGYDEDEVDAFLDLIEAELARLIQENTDLRTRVESLEQQLAAPVDTGSDLRRLESLGPLSPPPLREQTSPGGDQNVHAARVLGLAQEMADRLTGEAKAEADAMISQARTKSEQLLAEARAKAEGMVNDARTRSETMLNDARTKAETLERQSRDKAASLERDAAAKHTEIIAGLRQEKGVLEKKIDELHTYERGYRTRLKTYLDSQLRELGGIGSAAPADPTHTQQGLVGSGFGAHAEAGSR
ncbi:MAG: DivIVA domain-containing protein [Actinobacteria bacterium]|nr:DivIVA domain-containing protein [Actinomycetota bacterium]